jgi:hypothetical protein
MNVIDIVKNNTDYQNNTDIYNAIADGCGKAVVPALSTSATVMTTGTIPDSVVNGSVFTNSAAAKLTLPAASKCTGKMIGFVASHDSIITIGVVTGELFYVMGVAGSTAKGITLPAT